MSLNGQHIHILHLQINRWMNSYCDKGSGGLVVDVDDYGNGEMKIIIMTLWIMCRIVG